MMNSSPCATLRVPQPLGGSSRGGAPTPPPGRATRAPGGEDTWWIRRQKARWKLRRAHNWPTLGTDVGVPDQYGSQDLAYKARLELGNRPCNLRRSPRDPA